MIKRCRGKSGHRPRSESAGRVSNSAALPMSALNLKSAEKMRRSIATVALGRRPRQQPLLYF